MGENKKGEEPKVKWCPMLGKYCIGEKCAIHIEMKNVSQGMIQVIGMCSINALVKMISDINMKTQGSKTGIEIPKIYRG
uniref:Uncharacterized protein n=1 Tax=viral metagenome TaxID=1070528 RepID=A0A6H1ZT71_9ZZZZ